MDTRIRIIAEDLTKDGANALNRLIELERQLKVETEAANQAQRNSNTETNKSIGIIKSLEDEIQRLIKARKESTDTTQIAAYNRQIGLQEAELKKLTDTQQKSIALTKEQNAQIQSLTGNTEKSNGMFENLAATMLGLFAVDRIIDYSKQMFELVINSDRMNIALKNVTQSNQEYHESLEFLNKLSNNYGQNVNTLKESYVSFLASSKSTNLSVKERQGIYESIIKAGSALTLSNDEIEGSLRAVSQMFSKGNVSAEELRGQLGERIPGAFGIMAEALGVNEKKLNKMLEQGEVLAEDALPKFAKALEAAYGDKAKSNIDTVTGASNRFGRSLTENLTKINESTGFTKTLASGINFLADNFKSLVNVMIGAGAALAAYTLKQTASSAIGRIQLINLGQEVLAKQAASVATLELTAAETAAAAAATRFNAAVAAAPWGLALVALSGFVTMVMEHNDAVQRAYELTEDGIKATDEQIKGERAHAIELGLTIEQTKKLAYGTEERLSNVRKLMAQYPQYFKDMTAEQVSNWHLTNAYRGVNKEIERKITLLAREKAVEKQTDRLVDIKLELESMGVYVKTLKEFNLEEQKRGFHINVNGPKIHDLLKEQDKLSTSLIKTTERLSDSQKQMFNQEAQANKAKLQAKLITEQEFKAEVMRIQEVYGIKVQNYKIEETLLGKSVDNNKKANKEKITDFEKYMAKKSERESKYFEDAKKDMDKSVDSYIKALKKQNEDEAKAQKDLIKEKEERKDASFKKMQQSLLLEKVANATTLEEIEELQKEHNQTLLNYDLEKLQSKLKIQKQELLIAKSTGALYLEEELKRKKDIEKTETEILDLKVKINGNVIENKKDALKKEADLEKENADYVKDLWEKTLDETEKEFEKRQKNFEHVFESSFDVVAQIVDEFYEHLDKKSKEGETAAERQGAAINKAFLEPMKENVNAAKALISGDYLGAAKGLVGYFEGIWKTTFGIKNTLNEIRLNEFNIQWESTMSNLESYSEAIKENFEGLADDSIEFNATQKTGVDALIDAEIKRAGQIKETYTLALSKEDELYQQKLKNIETLYNEEVSKINAKYALEDTLANQRFSADSLAIQTNLNQGLLALLTNEESKTSITADYAGRRSAIMQTFALADTEITNATTEAERAAINAAIEARTKALSELESWYTTELEFTVNSEGQKRKEYSDTAQLIKDAKDAQELLDIQYTANEIQRTLDKNTELQALEAQKKADELSAKTIHDAELVRLETEKNAAMLNSFNALKEAMKNGYSEILQSATEAFSKGLITAEQYLSKLNEVNNLRQLIGDLRVDTTIPRNDFTPNIGIQAFKTGTEMVGGIKGVDKNLAWLSNDEAVLQGDLNKKRLDAGINRFKMVEYAINYKSILDGDFQPLQIKTSALDKLEEHKAMQYLMNLNMNGVIDKLDRVESALKSIPIQNFTLDENGLSKYVETKNNVTKFKAKRLK